MQELFGFHAELVERDGARWEIVVQPGDEPAQVLAEVLGVVQRRLDATDALPVTICFDGREYTMSPPLASLASARAPGWVRGKDRPARQRGARTRV